MKQEAKISLAACAAEFVGMGLFVIFGCGSAMGIAGSGSEGGSGGQHPVGGNSTADSTGSNTSVLPSWVLMVALVFGLSITMLAYALGPYSGGQFNCAVTFGLVLAGHCQVVQGIANLFSQLLGSIAGAAILCAIYPVANDMTHSLASNSVGPRWHWWNALFGEIVGTLLLVLVVLQTACNPKSAFTRQQACLAIGLAIFAAHTVLIPIDGCSINPTRSFGPALLSLGRAMPAELIRAQALLQPTVTGTAAGSLAPALVPVGNATAAADTNGTLSELVTTAVPSEVAAALVALTTPAPKGRRNIPSQWRDMWIFWVGPCIGAALAAGIYRMILALPDGSSDEEPGEKDQLAEVEASSRPVLLGGRPSAGSGIAKATSMNSDSAASELA